MTALTVVVEGRLRIEGLVADGTRSRVGSTAPGGAGHQVLGRRDHHRPGHRGRRLVLDLDSQGSQEIVQLSSGALPEALPVVKGVDATTAPKSGSFSSTSANEFAVDPVIPSQSVPFLGPNGLMIDYAMLSTNRTVYEQNSTVYVLARADAPVAMTQGLQERGASVTTTLAGVQKTLDQSAYALALRLYAVVAALVLLMALAGLFVSTAVQLLHDGVTRPRSAWSACRAARSCPPSAGGGARPAPLSPAWPPERSRSTSSSAR